jgi:membrane-associated progesterone receptor component
LPYFLALGLDVSRALAKMSFAPEDLSSTDLSDLTPEQLKILDDWEEKFEQKKKYPVVGRMQIKNAAGNE